MSPKRFCEILDEIQYSIFKKLDKYGNYRSVNEDAARDAVKQTLESAKEHFGNVKIKTLTETATSERGIYDMITGIVSIFGSVKIFRGNDQLTGEYGEVNLKTGISRLLNTPPSGGKKGRVRAVFCTKKKVKIEPKESQPPR